jgi:hypothetical protein
MRCNSFGRGVFFAVLAAAGLLPWVLLTRPVVGTWNAQALYLIGVTVCYVAGLKPPSAGALRVAVIAALAAGGAALAARTTSELAISLAAIVGIARSGFLYRAAPARAAVAEVTLLVSGLLFARFLGGPDPVSTAFAVWGFLLVQSLFFLVAGVRPRGVALRIDPFEEAHRRAFALLDDPR